MKYTCEIGWLGCVSWKWVKMQCSVFPDNLNKVTASTKATQTCWYCLIISGAVFQSVVLDNRTFFQNVKASYSVMYMWCQKVQSIRISNPVIRKSNWKFWCQKVGVQSCYWRRNMLWGMNLKFWHQTFKFWLDFLILLYQKVQPIRKAVLSLLWGCSKVWNLKFCYQDLKFWWIGLALLKAQICMISFQTCTQIFGIHKSLIHVMR